MSLANKRRLPASLPPPRKKRKVSAIEEITFDASAREDYLTGFRKRKLQRIKQAKEEAAKREREDRIVARKQLRDERKAELEEHVEAVNLVLRRDRGELEGGEDSSLSGEREEWGGIEEKAEVGGQEEYVDEDNFTTVTIEAVDISKEGLRKIKAEGEVEEDGEGEARRPEDPKRGKRIWTKDAPNSAKKKKRKFRYESKAERQVTRRKERTGSKAQAKMRRSE